MWEKQRGLWSDPMGASGLAGRVVWEGFPEEVTLKRRLRGGGVGAPQAERAAQEKPAAGGRMPVARPRARRKRQRPESSPVFKVQGEIIGGPQTRFIRTVILF